MKAILYPGSFDPITNGHLDLIQRAVRLFDQVIIGVSASEAKRTCFTVEERLVLAQAVCEPLSPLKLFSFDNLLVDFARAQGTCMILRGLRSISDFDYELQMNHVNRTLAPQLECIFLTPRHQTAYISSSLVREVAALGGDVSPFVHPIVEQALREKFNHGVNDH